jgi:hypothetical protein
MKNTLILMAVVALIAGSIQRADGQVVTTLIETVPVSPKTEVDNTEPKIVRKKAVNASVCVPLLWRCQIEDMACTIQLPDLEFVAIHNYVVDGMVEVTEATAAMKSKAFVRFYFVEPASQGGMIGDRLKEGAERAADLSDRFIKPALTPSIQNTRSDKVLKNYPATTHAQMIEYRVKTKEAVYDIYQSLDRTLLEYRGLPLIESQWTNIVRKVSVKVKE